MKKLNLKVSYINFYKMNNNPILTIENKNK